MARLLFNRFDLLLQCFCYNQYCRQINDHLLHSIQSSKKANEHNDSTWSGKWLTVSYQTFLKIAFFQIGTLVTSLVTKVMTITSLIKATPLLNLYGPLACDAFYLITVAHNTLVVTGGFVMALFRMLCVQFHNHVLSLERLMLKLMWVQLVLFLVIWGTNFFAVDIYGSSNLSEFCNGYTTKVTKTVSCKYFGHTYSRVM